MGSTIMRQYHMSFIIDEKKLGVARANCNESPYTVDEEDYKSLGYDLGLKAAKKDIW